MKLNDTQTKAINEMAKQLYLIDQASEAKANELKKFIVTVDKDEASFREGVPFEFALDTDTGRQIVRGTLVLKMQRKWEAHGLTFEKVV